jgi:D-alanyl-lipoteichoic acid acyltransferase DltB (MBOAT superfamily)
LWTSLGINLGFLGVFKYYNFFVDSWVEAFAGLGIDMEVSTLSIILPVGISFYTFQTLSYTIDVYRKQLEPTSSLLNFAA